jgi:hypothetical protein
VATYVVDDEGHCLDINTASEDICGDQDFRLTRAEGVDDDITLRSIEFTSKASNRVAFFIHTSLNLKSSLTSLKVF